MAVKCKINMSDRLLPMAGSVAGEEGRETGTCPECETPGVMLSIVGGFVRAHVIASVPVPENSEPRPVVVADERRTHPHASSKVGTGLSEPQVEVTDTGVRVGAPRAAERVRQVQIEGAAGTGTVQVPRKVDSGKVTKSGKPRMVTKLVDVPASEAHVREALEYWRKRNPRKAKDGSVSDVSRKRQNDMVSLLARRLEAIVGAQVPRVDETTGQVARESTGAVAFVSVPVAEQLALSSQVDAAQGHRGPTLVRGRAMEATRTEPRERKDDKPVRPSCDGPLGRERFDRKITDVPEPAPVLSQSQKRAARRRKCKAAFTARAVAAGVRV